MRSEDCLKLAEDTQRTLWVGTDDGLLRFAEGDSSHLGTKDGLCHAHITALCPSRNGMLWIGSEGGLNVAEAGRIRGGHQADVRGPVTSLAEDIEGRLWIGCGAELRCYDPGSGESRVVHPPRKRGQLHFATVHAQEGAGVYVVFYDTGCGVSLFSHRADGWQDLGSGGTALVESIYEPTDFFLVLDSEGALVFPSTGLLLRPWDRLHSVARVSAVGQGASEGRYPCGL